MAPCAGEDNPVQPDIVVLDLVLREGSGFSLLGRLAGYGCDAVVFSDLASPAVAHKCRRMGALDAITKADLRRFRTFLRDYAVGRRRARASPPAARNRWRQLSAAGIRSRRKSLE